MKHRGSKVNKGAHLLGFFHNIHMATAASSMAAVSLGFGGSYGLAIIVHASSFVGVGQEWRRWMKMGRWSMRSVATAMASCRCLRRKRWVLEKICCHSAHQRRKETCERGRGSLPPSPSSSDLKDSECGVTPAPVVGERQQRVARRGI